MPDNSVSKTTESTRIVAALEATLSKYVALDSGLPLVLALWILATHVFDCFDAFPYLAITSPTKRCGKTRLAEIIELAVCGGFRTANASCAAIFRMIQSRTAESQTITLIMDEMEVLATKSERAEQLREVLNAGYRRGQPVIRCERTSGDGFEVREFNVYCPKVLVLIGNLNDTVGDRCIPIAMRRRKIDEQLERFFYAQEQRHAKRLVRDIEKWANASRGKVLRRARRDIEILEDREAELWSPLFAVCGVAATDRLEELTSTALKISRAKQADEPAQLELLLLTDIRDVFGQSELDRLSTTSLLQQLNAVAESPWGSWSHGQGLDARSLARKLKPFKIQAHNIRLFDDAVAKGYERIDFQEAWELYLPRDLSATPLQPNTDAGSSDFPCRYSEEDVADRNCEIANKNTACSAVAVPKKVKGENQSPPSVELIPPMPDGVILVSWELKPAPVMIAAGETVTDPAKFARGCLEQLRNALANPRRRAAWTVPQLVERLALVGVLVELTPNSTTT